MEKAIGDIPAGPLGKSDAVTLIKFLASLPDQLFVVGMYISDTSHFQLEWMDALSGRLREKGYIVVGLCTSAASCECKFTKTHIFSVVDSALVSQLGRINVFVALDIDCRVHFPPSSKVLACMHAFWLPEPGEINKFCTKMHFMSWADGYMVPMPINQDCRHATKRLWEGALNPSLFHRMGNNFHIIPSGYPRMGLLCEKLANCHVRKDALVFAPHAIDAWHHPCKSDISDYITSVLQMLHKAYPEFEIIFRPMISDWRFPAMRKICHQFSGLSNFTLDLSREKFNSFSRAAVLISDFSLIAQSYAFTTLRPAIYFQPWKKVNEREKYWNGGFYAYTQKELLETVRYCLDHADDEKDRIEHQRNLYAMPYENAIDEMANWLEDFYYNRPRQNWLTVNRHTRAVKSSQQLFDELCELPEKWAPACFAIAAKYSYPENPLFFAHAMWMGKKLFPHQKCTIDMDEVSIHWLGYPISSKKFREIDTGAIKRLYEICLISAIREGNMQMKTFLEEIIRSLNL